MTLNELLEKLASTPESVEFDQIINVIGRYYDYTPCAFRNGDANNPAGSNEGSCKIFAFAKLNKLDPSQTLACFGTYYRDDVLGNPGGSDHANIRNFIEHGWEGIHFEGVALVAR